MKLITKLTAGIVSMGLVASAFAADPVKPLKFELPQTTGTTQPAAPAAAPAAPAAPAIKFSQSQLMEVYGLMLALRSNMPDLEFTAADVDAIAKGMKMALAQEKPAYDMQAIGPQFQEMMTQKQQVLLGKIHDQNVADSTTFFAKLKENKAVQILPSGLGIEVLKAATGPTVKPGQLAKFHYQLSTLNGQTLQSTAGQDAPELQVIENQMIPGMFEGLQKVPTGAKYRLYVPYKLAYGEQGNQDIPPAASLVFEVEVLGVRDLPKEAAPAAK